MTYLGVAFASLMAGLSFGFVSGAMWAVSVVMESDPDHIRRQMEEWDEES